MAETYGRILSDTQHVDYFLKNALHMDTILEKDEYTECLKLITSAAMLNEKVSGKDTLSCKSFRIPPYVEDRDRRDLRKRIYHELVSEKRPMSDDKISLGKGGALPQAKLQKGRCAFYIIGLPASGKSEISNVISEQFGAIILDSDFAKRKFPEYSSEYGASVVHEESSIITFGGKDSFAVEPNVLQFSVENEYNIVIPKIGHTQSGILGFARGLKNLGYSNHLVLVRLDREKAAQRALIRYKNTRRYVPLELIFDVYGNDPTITFYDFTLLDTEKTFDSYLMISSDVPKETPKEVLYISTNCPITKEMLGMGCKGCKSK